MRPRPLRYGPRPGFGAVVKRLPSVFFHPRAVREAKDENMTVLQWWQDLAAVNSTAKKTVVKARKAAPRMTGAAQAAALQAFGSTFNDLQKMRDELDALKGRMPAKEWNAWNAKWYGWIAALSVGMRPSGSAVGGFGIEPTTLAFTVTISVLVLATLLALSGMMGDWTKVQMRYFDVVEKRGWGPPGSGPGGGAPGKDPWAKAQDLLILAAVVGLGLYTAPMWMPVVSGGFKSLSTAKA